MPHHRATYRIERTPHDVFDIVAIHSRENHPRWEAEVVEIRPSTTGPVGLGSRSVMVREERGRRIETEYEVTAFEEDRLIAFHHTTGPMGFDLRFELAPEGDRATSFTVDVRMTPRGLLRLATPLLAIELPRRTDRISRRMIALVEGRLDVQPVVGPAIPSPVAVER